MTDGPPVVGAKVATILGTTKLALNKGSSAGVTVGSTVTLFHTVEIVDPVTQEMLGTVTSPKLRLKVREVQELLSVASVTDLMKNPRQTGALFEFLASRPVVEIRQGAHDPHQNDEVGVTVGELAEILVDQSEDDSQA